MTRKLILSILLILSFFVIPTYQILPYYSTSPSNFYVNQAKAPVGSGLNVYTLPATFPISTAVHRKPFIAITSEDLLKTYYDQAFYFLPNVYSYNSTTLAIAMFMNEVNITNTSGTYHFYYGF